MGLDYSYTQPSQSADYGGGGGYSSDSGVSSTDWNIMLDQKEIEAARLQSPQPPEVDMSYPRECYSYSTRVQYPPQPEVEFGFPKECYCGGEPVIKTNATSIHPGRRFFSCENTEDGDCHIHKWWDDAATEEIKALSSQCGILSDKVDHVAGVSDYESEVMQVKELYFQTEQKVAMLEKSLKDLSNKSTSYGFELLVGVMVVVVLVVSMVVMFH